MQVLSIQILNEALFVLKQFHMMIYWQQEVMDAAKEAGKVRLEGKEYIVQDGDVIHFRFNV